MTRYFLHSMLACTLLISLLNRLPAQLNPTSDSIVKLEWINFGPYTKPGQSPGSGTLPESQLIALLDSIQLYVEGIRTYGTEGGLEKIPQLAKERGFNVMVGIYLGPDLNANNAQMAKGIEIANAGFADRLIVGGEAVYTNLLTPSQLIAYILQAKAACPTIPVTTAEVYSVLITHPEIPEACDFIFPNIYPYYEGLPVECALQWFDQTYRSLLDVANGKQIMISETGWKTSGPVVGEAIPSFENAIRYHRELKGWSQEKEVPVTVFSAFDEPWKIPLNDDGWGIFTSEATLKPGMDSIFDPLNNPEDTWSCTIAPLTGADTIILDYIPVIGSFDVIRGHLNHLNTCDFRIATYIKVGSGWWTKPTFDLPAVPVLCNGLWTVDHTAGGNDHLATEMCFFLLPEDYTPAPCSGCATIPEEVYTNAVTTKCIQRYLLNDVSITASDPVICAGESTTLTALGGTQYLWSTGEASPTVVVAPEATTTYAVTITDGTGGGAITTVTVSVLPEPNFSIGATPDTIDAGSSSILNVTGAGSISFVWSTGETTRVIEVNPLTTTTYTVTATGGNGCMRTDSVTIVVNPVVSTAVLQPLGKINVFPVPAHGTLNLESKGPDINSLTVSLLNSMGSVLTHQTVWPAGEQFNIQFDISAFPQGLYFLVMQSETGEIRTEKVPIY